jgi:hypothetical protein
MRDDGQLFDVEGGSDVTGAEAPAQVSNVSMASSTNVEDLRHVLWIDARLFSPGI